MLPQSHIYCHVVPTLLLHSTSTFASWERRDPARVLALLDRVLSVDRHTHVAVSRACCFLCSPHSLAIRCGDDSTLLASTHYLHHLHLLHSTARSSIHTRYAAVDSSSPAHLPFFPYPSNSLQVVAVDFEGRAPLSTRHFCYPPRPVCLPAPVYDC